MSLTPDFKGLYKYFRLAGNFWNCKPDLRKTIVLVYQIKTVCYLSRIPLFVINGSLSAVHQQTAPYTSSVEEVGIDPFHTPYIF